MHCYLNFKRLLILPFLGLILISGCTRRTIEPEEPVIVNPEPKPKFFDENSWIYAQMVKYYLWEKSMPPEDSTDKNLEPVDYFYSLVNKEKDRYSYARDNYSEIADYWNGNQNAHGFRFTRFSENGTDLKLAVSLVLRGSPAETEGLQRGDIITGINGNTITASNLDELLALNTATFSIKGTNDSTRNLTMNKKKFQINPLQTYKIIPWEGKKVGYLVYTQFLFNHETETREIFRYFKTNKIDEMIVDFRFNPGGVTPIAEVIASLLGPDLGTTHELFHGEVNAYQTAQSGGASFRSFTNETDNLSGLKRLYAITSRSSASSSELVINCLKPYRPVYTVGGNTYGKNVISIIVSDESGKYPYTLMPAWSTIVNASGQSEYGNENGIIPDYPASDNLLPYLPLGDANETLLNKALNAIAPATTARSKTITEQKVQLLDGFHHFDTGSSFLGNKMYNK